MSKNHYVSNAVFLEAIKEYRTKVEEEKASNKPIPKIPEYLATCVMLIAKNLSNMPKFFMYTFKDEMIGDVIENCIMYFHNFDPEKSGNPFAYFTQISYYAFLRRIAKEKKQLYVKYKSFEQFGTIDEHEKTELEENGVSSEHFEMYDNISDFIGTYEDSVKKKKQKYINTKKTKLELLFEDDIGDSDVPI